MISVLCCSYFHFDIPSIFWRCIDNLKIISVLKSADVCGDCITKIIWVITNIDIHSYRVHRGIRPALDFCNSISCVQVKNKPMSFICRMIPIRITNPTIKGIGQSIRSIPTVVIKVCTCYAEPVGRS